MFFVLSQILSFLIKPTFWVIILLASAILIKKRMRLFLLLTLFTFLFFGNDYIYKKIVKSWEIPQTNFNSLKEYEAGIVLGGFSEYDYITKRHNFKKEADRLIYTINLYNNKKIKKIFISGGNGSLINTDYKESETIKEFLIQHGISKSDIIIESKSRNTKENAVETSKIIDLKKRYLLITSATHMKRALFCFNKVNIDVDPFPVDNSMSRASKNIEYLILPRARTFELWEELIHEIVGLYVYKITWKN